MLECHRGPILKLALRPFTIRRGSQQPSRPHFTVMRMLSCSYKNTLSAIGGNRTLEIYRVKPHAFRTNSRAFVASIRWCSSHKPAVTATPSSPSTSSPLKTADNSQKRDEKIDNSDTVIVEVHHGLPQLTVTLPSRNERCRFTLRPVTQTVKDIVEQLQAEDRGIDRAVLRTSSGVRIASSCSIESLLTEDFQLIINDKKFNVAVPMRSRDSTEELSDLGNVKHLVGNLYAALNIDEHQLKREREVLMGIEDIKSKLVPLEKKRESLVSSAERRTLILSWAGLGFMAVQFGFLARLTWWEYSWDIMEPVTYFVTYGTSMAAFAYYVVTRQDFILPEVRDRQFLLSFHRRAKKAGLNVDEYNALKERLSILEGDLARLRDPLAINLPPNRIEQDPKVYDVVHKAHLSIKNFLGMNKDPSSP